MENTEQKEEEILVEPEENQENFGKKKIDFRFELALFLILGFLLGVVIKTEAVKRVTIGFNDNLIASQKQSYDMEKIKAEIAKEAEAQNQAAQEAQDSQNSQAPQAPQVPQGNPAGVEVNQ